MENETVSTARTVWYLRTNRFAMAPRIPSLRWKLRKFLVRLSASTSPGMQVLHSIMRGSMDRGLSGRGHRLDGLPFELRHPDVPGQFPEGEDDLIAGNGDNAL